MSEYVILSRLTDEGRKTLKSKPGRLREVNEEMAKMGARVKMQYALLGEYDFLTVVEAPDPLTMAKVLVEIGSRGTLETMALAAMPVDELLNKLKG